MEFKTAQSIPGLILFLASTGHTKISDNGNLKLPYGEITGKVHSDYFAFFGLPYAEPPTGARRWQPAEPYTTSWTNTRDASNKQNVPGCYQPDNGSAPEKMSEDCLFLNVYTPKNSDGKSLPVMLWIHGGSWQHGHGNTDIYDGESLVKKDVVLVTINYRLGSFGFLYDEEATGNRLWKKLLGRERGSIPGNQAVTDWLQALKWTKENINLFNGDSNKITIFGESAGAQSVATIFSSLNQNHASQPETLFSRAIVQSSPFGIPYKSKDQGVELTDEFLKKLDCADWDCAKSRSAESIINAQSKTHGFKSNEQMTAYFETWTPVIDGDLVQIHPLDGLGENVRNSGKQLILGHTSSEGSVFVYSIFKNMVFKEKMGKIAYETAIKLMFKSHSDLVLRKFQSPCGLIDIGCDTRDYLSKVVGNYLFDCPSRFAVRPRAKSSDDTYYYLFDTPMHQSLFPDTKEFEICKTMSCHAAELPFVFNSTDFGNPNQEKLSENMIDYWTNFAKFGTPNGVDSETFWKPHSRPDYDVVHLKTENENKNLYENTDELSEVCDFWDGLAAYLRY